MNEVLYDGDCPICVDEMRALIAIDHWQSIRYIDMRKRTHYRGVSQAKALGRLHVITNDNILTGVEANVFLWRSLNQKPWLEILLLPGINTLAEIGYGIFAKHRFFISRLLGYRSCSVCQQGIDNDK